MPNFKILKFILLPVPHSFLIEEQYSKLVCYWYRDKIIEQDSWLKNKIDSGLESHIHLERATMIIIICAWIVSSLPAPVKQSILLMMDNHLCLLLHSWRMVNIMNHKIKSYKSNWQYDQKSCTNDWNSIKTIVYYTSYHRVARICNTLPHSLSLAKLRLPVSH